MATLLTITNKVLKRLREDTVADLTDTYANLIASFVADITAEVNEATIWNALDHEVTVSVVAGTSSYVLTGTTNQSQLLFTVDDRPQAWVFDDSSDRYGEQMSYLDPSEYYRRLQVDRDIDNSKPYFFTVEFDTDNDDLYIRLWPEPSAAAYIRIRFNTPEVELDPDTDEDTEIKMPERVVRLGALWMALNERGEEIGEGGPHHTRYIMSRGAAVENEIRARERTGVYDWVRN